MKNEKQVVKMVEELYFEVMKHQRKDKPKLIKNWCSHCKSYKTYKNKEIMHCSNCGYVENQKPAQKSPLRLN